MINQFLRGLVLRGFDFIVYNYDVVAETQLNDETFRLSKTDEIFISGAHQEVTETAPYSKTLSRSTDIPREFGQKWKKRLSSISTHRVDLKKK